MKRREMFVMKKFLGAFFSILVGVAIFVPSAYAEDVNIYAPYDSFEDMRNAYVEAIESGNVEKQRELYELGHSTLQKEIELSKKAFDEEPLTRANPDEQYWIAQFPKLFSSGSWIVRDGTVSLSLTPLSVVRYGTRADATRGWNSLYTKFRNHANWQNTSSMEGQYYCHWERAKVKPQWNLEPGKPTFDPYSCN